MKRLVSSLFLTSLLKRLVRCLSAEEKSFILCLMKMQYPMDGFFCAEMLDRKDLSPETMWLVILFNSVKPPCHISSPVIRSHNLTICYQVTENDFKKILKTSEVIKQCIIMNFNKLLFTCSALLTSLHNPSHAFRLIAHRCHLHPWTLLQPHLL